MSKRLKPEIRKGEILAAAVQLAAVGHYMQITRDQIAEAAGVTGPIIHHYFHTMAQLRRAVMRAAIHGEVLPVIAQGLVAGDVHAKGAPDDVKRAALAAYS